MTILAIFAGALIVHIISTLFIMGHEMDIYCFSNWSGLLYEHGFDEFYTLRDDDGNPVFNDYPPGYMYVLWLVAAVYKLFNVSFSLDVPSSAILLKMPAMLCDLGIGYVIYLIARKYTDNKKALFGAVLYMFNPVIIINSSVWGQVDSVFTLCVLLMCYFVTEKKLIISYFIFAIGILIKPQTLMYTPVLIYGIIDQVFLSDFKIKRMIKHLCLGMCAIGMIVLLAMPFGLSNVISQYIDTMTSYQYASVNAYNIWALFGKNWVDQNSILFFLPCKTWGSIAIVVTVVVSAVFCLKHKDKESKYYMTGAFIIASVFMTSVRMHERYMYPALALLLAAAVVKRQKKLFYVYGALCFIHMLNTVHVLQDYMNSQDDKYIVQAFSLLSVCTWVYMCVVLLKEKNIDDTENMEMPSVNDSKWIKKDFLLMSAITVIYACVAFYRLGDINVPESGWEIKQGEEIVLDFAEGKQFSKVVAYDADSADKEIEMYISLDGEQWEKALFAVESGFGNMKTNAYGWSEHTFMRGARYVKLLLLNDVATVNELMFYDSEGNVLTPANVADYHMLFDEQGIYAGEVSYMNSRYDAEISDNSQTPLVKWIINVGIAIWGICPFGWRFMGALFGVLMLPVMYMLARKLTDKMWVAGVCAGLYALDFMHFTQTRISAGDALAVLCIMLGYYFMIKYSKSNMYDAPLGKTLIPLFMSGVCMSLLTVTKKNGIYSGIGLVIIYIAVMIKMYMEYKKANEDYKGFSSGVSHRKIIKYYKSYTLKAMLIWIAVCVISPLVLYKMTYSSLDAGLQQEVTSEWYQWPTMIKTIVYYAKNVGPKMTESVTVLGNPFIWWSGLCAFVYMVYRIFKKHDKTAFLIIVAAMSQYVPCIFIKECANIYDYFPTVPFIILMIGYSIYYIVKGINKKSVSVSLVVAYIAVVFIAFVMFYPVISGGTISDDGLKCLKWFNDWSFTK